MNTRTPFQLARSAARKYRELYGDYNHYTGILALHGYARLASLTADPDLLTEVTAELGPYVRGEQKFHANFPNYYCGGNATAWMFSQGYLPEGREAVRHYAEEILHEAPRTASGVLCFPRTPSQEVVFIDAAFAVTPFLLFAGLGLEDETYLEEAFQQTSKMTGLLRDPDTGLFHQALNFRSPGHRTEDHWSRGNGWAALALVELAVYLPDGHARKAEAVERFQDHVAACARFQDQEGLWHQEMTLPELAYVETSGSGLMLYALGAGIAAGQISADEQARFEKGLRGLSSYIAENGDIFHTCTGCLCPGNGKVIDYLAKPPVRNDRHAFGAVALAMGQAHLMGVPI